MNRFPDNARVCFVGDSITAAFDYPIRIADHYISKFPHSGIRFYNCGVGGSSALAQRIFLKDDTLPHKPTHAVIMTGINDSGRWFLERKRSQERYDGLKEHYINYQKNLVALCDELEKENIEITLCTPVPYAEYQDSPEKAVNGCCALITAYAEFCRNFAAERGYPLCDYHKYITEKMQTEDLFKPDRVHPNEKGQYYIAKCFLKFQGMELCDFAPIPERYSGLRRIDDLVRIIYAVELMVIGTDNYEKSYEEKMNIVRDYIKEGKAPNEFFKTITAQYLRDKQHQNEFTQKINELTDLLMLPQKD